VFKGEEVVRLPPGLTGERLREKVEEVLSALGRTRVEERGLISIEPREKLGSFLTEVSMEGSLRPRSNGHEVSVSYECKPTVANWVISGILLLTTCVGGAVILVPLQAKSSVGKAVRSALADLEDECR